MPSTRTPIHALVTTAALLAFNTLATPYARAAESYDNCTNFIDTLPATIGTQGTWCLRHDLSTGLNSGMAITIGTNNVTIDCNDFKLGGLAAGAGTATIGVYAANRLNATVRNCNIRGFRLGLHFVASGGPERGGHLVEDNRFESNTMVGMQVEGDGSVVRRNHVTDTGGSTTDLAYAIGINTFYSVDIIDNTVTGVMPLADEFGYGFAGGIYTESDVDSSIVGNRVRGIVGQGGAAAVGIYNVNSGRINMERNHVAGNGSVGSIGLRCFTATGAARDNTINGFELPVEGCTVLGNMVVP